MPLRTLEFIWPSHLTSRPSSLVFFWPGLTNKVQGLNFITKKNPQKNLMYSKILDSNAIDDNFFLILATTVGSGLSEVAYYWSRWATNIQNLVVCQSWITDGDNNEPDCVLSSESGNLPLRNGDLLPVRVMNKCSFYMLYNIDRLLWTWLNKGDKILRAYELTSW